MAYNNDLAIGFNRVLRDRLPVFDITCFCFRIGFKFAPLGLKGGILPLTADGITNPGRVFGALGGVSVVLIFWGRSRAWLFFSLFCFTGCTLRSTLRRLLG
jgi:hypothetical protein